MKKSLKAFLLAALVACGVCAFAFAGCSGKTYTGEYSYTSWGTNYGIKVQVEVDGNDKISNIRIAGSTYTEVSPATGDWTQANVDNWNNHIDGLLKNYVGKSVDEILAIEVAVGSYGSDLEPKAQGDEGFIAYDSDLLISGATVGSGRLLLAVQNALKDYKK